MTGADSGGSATPPFDRLSPHDHCDQVLVTGLGAWDIEAERERRAKTNKAAVARQREPRASTTDAQARVMKMADGGFRPAYTKGP